jgi:hypothetical protein
MGAGSNEIGQSDDRLAIFDKATPTADDIISITTWLPLLSSLPCIKSAV